METALPTYSYHTLTAYRGYNCSVRYVRSKVASSGSPLYNAARNELYFVPISGLWVTRPLLSIDRSCSSNTMILTALEAAADCCTGLHTATFNSSHILRCVIAVVCRHNRNTAHTHTHTPETRTPENKRITTSNVSTIHQLPSNKYTRHISLPSLHSFTFVKIVLLSCRYTKCAKPSALARTHTHTHTMET